MPGTTIISQSDDALQAIKVTDRDNSIVLFTPTGSQKGYPFTPFANTITTYDKTIFAMEYTNGNFEGRHKSALGDQAAAAVIVVVLDGPDRKNQEAFAAKVWDAACKDEEMAGILVLIGGVGPARAVGGFKTVVHGESGTEATQVEMARAIFG